MKGEGLGRGGLFFIIWLMVSAVGCGLDWLIEGHLSKGIGYFSLSIWGILLIATVMERLDTIRDNTQEIKEQNETIQKRLDDLLREKRIS